jgi:hypothetical protein
MATKRKTKAKKKVEINDDLDIFERESQYASNVERYQDFKNLFFSTPQGEKVLREILGMGYILNDTIKYNKYGVDQNATLISTGERKLALAIHKLATVEPPPPPPTKQTTRR